MQYVLIALGLAFALWLNLRPLRNGTFSELWGAPSDEDYVEDGLPPRRRPAFKRLFVERLFASRPEDEEPVGSKR